MTLEAAADFLMEMAIYFERRPAHGEDAAHWSNVQNAENCRKIAALLSPAASSERSDDSQRRGSVLPRDHINPIPTPEGR